MKYSSTFTKAYNALDWGFYLNIITAYGVVPRALHILRRYWDCLYMVAWAGSYFGDPFKGQRGVTQGNPLPPMIFNMVVDAVLQNWVSMVAEEE